DGNCRTKLERRGCRGNSRKHDHRLVEIRHLAGEQVAHIVLRRDVIIAPYRMVAKLLAENALADQILRSAKRDRIHDAFKTGRDAYAELHNVLLSWLLLQYLISGRRLVRRR